MDFKSTEIGELNPTLFQIIYGIIWELSYHGAPSSRNKATSNLKKISEKVMNQVKGD